MISAKLIFKLCLISLAVSGVAFILAANGVNGFRVVVFPAILLGVGAVAVGLIAVATGTIKNDVRD